MDDPNFFRTVVLMVRHTEEESFGVVINRPTSFTMEKVVAMVCEKKCVHEGVLYCGGPVDGPLMSVHNSESLGNVEFAPGLFLSSDQDQLLQLFECEFVQLKLFDGFSGWSSGQLEEEIDQGCWIVTDISPEDVFSEDPELWERLIKQVGDDILSEGVHLPVSEMNGEWN